MKPSTCMHVLLRLRLHNTSSHFLESFNASFLITLFCYFDFLLVPSILESDLKIHVLNNNTI